METDPEQFVPNEPNTLLSRAMYFLEVCDDGKWTPSECAWTAHSLIQRAWGLQSGRGEDAPALSERAKQMVAQMEMETAVEEAMHSAREAYPYHGKS